MKTTIVTTTIYSPVFLKEYAENVKRFGHSNVDFIVIGDRKTPTEARELCESMEDCWYLSIEDQKNYLWTFSRLLKHHPENSIARRNLGHLLAYIHGADKIIMLDDDNLSIADQDFVRGHSKVGMRCGLPSMQSSDGWFNVCDALEEEHGVQFYARGFPPSKRWAQRTSTKIAHYSKVAVNAGLWTNDPDIDAITRLERRLITKGFREWVHTEFSLYPGTWSPWNCQNTAISSKALVSYFLSPHAGRHLDIWASYITTRIAEAQGEVIAFGTPLAFHDRSPHNLYKDLEQELPWIQATDEFCDVLRSIAVPSTGYLDGLAAVIDGLKQKWSHPVKDKYLEGLSAWHNTFKQLGAR